MSTPSAANASPPPRPHPHPVPPTVALALLLWAASALLGAFLWTEASGPFGTSLAEHAAPIAHALLPRGRAWPSSPSGGFPYWLPHQEPSLVAPSGSQPSQLLESIAQTGLLFGLLHGASFALVWTAYRRWGHPPYWRPAGPARAYGLDSWAWFLLALAAAASCASIWPALARFAWVLWWKFDVFDTFGGFDTAGRSVTRQGAAVALGRFGVSGLWLGAALGYLLILMACARSTLRFRLRRLPLSDRLCPSCGFSMWRGVDHSALSAIRCPECGLLAPPPLSPADAPSFGLHASPRRRRVLFVTACLTTLILLAWPLTYAWLGRVLPDSWVIKIPF